MKRLIGSMQCSVCMSVCCSTASLLAAPSKSAACLRLPVRHLFWVSRKKDLGTAGQGGQRKRGHQRHHRRPGRPLDVAPPTGPTPRPQSGRKGSEDPRYPRSSASRTSASRTSPDCRRCSRNVATSPIPRWAVATSSTSGRMRRGSSPIAASTQGQRPPPAGEPTASAAELGRSSSTRSSRLISEAFAIPSIMPGTEIRSRSARSPAPSR